MKLNLIKKDQEELCELTSNKLTEPHISRALNTHLYKQYLTATHLFIERVKEDGSLDRLSQTHLVGQDGVGALSPGEPQPVETLQLVGMQRTARAVQVLRLTLELYRRLRGGKENGTGL